MEGSSVNLYEYTDYRAYLRDFYLREKEKNRSYSYRVFANRAKLASPNYLKLVIDGARRITDKNLPTFVRGLRLTGEDAEYFRNLVFYQEAEDVEAKNAHLENMVKIRRRKNNAASEIEGDRLEILSSWHHWAMREMVLLKNFTDDPKWIADQLKNKITPKQAEESLALLRRLNFITKKNGKYVLSEPLLTTSDEISSLMLQRLHHQFIELGVDSIFNDPVGRREVNGLTIALSKNKVPQLKKAIKEFRKKLNQEFSDVEENEEVYQLIINFFPLTKQGG